MEIKREEVARGKKKEELLELLEQKAEELELGESQGRNEHGAVYVNQYFDLRIEKDPGYGDYRLMLMHKLQPPRSAMDRLRGKLRNR